MVLRPKTGELLGSCAFGTLACERSIERPRCLWRAYPLFGFWMKGLLSDEEARSTRAIRLEVP